MVFQEQSLPEVHAKTNTHIALYEHSSLQAYTYNIQIIQMHTRRTIHIKICVKILRDKLIFQRLTINSNSSVCEHFLQTHKHKQEQKYKCEVFHNRQLVNSHDTSEQIHNKTCMCQALHKLMHICITVLTCTHVQRGCLPPTCSVCDASEKSLDPYFLSKQKRKKKIPSYMKQTGNVWVTACMYVCVTFCVFCMCMCRSLVWSSAPRAGDQCLVIACL